MAPCTSRNLKRATAPACPSTFCCAHWRTEYGERAICVILSGTGADGSLGLKAIKEKGGLVIAQDPDEAAFDGMPRSAILTGAVDLVLPLASIPEALLKFHRRMALTRAAAAPSRTEHFSGLATRDRRSPPEKNEPMISGSIRRARCGAGSSAAWRWRRSRPTNIERYLDVLRGDEKELDRLATDLLINVTSFFRDPAVFDVLSEKIIPDLVRNHSIDQPLRIWIAGCSTGEETYSLAMLFREEITAAKREIKLQIFASDVDADAVATAREGLYPGDDRG